MATCSKEAGLLQDSSSKLKSAPWQASALYHTGNSAFPCQFSFAAIFCQFSLPPDLVTQPGQRETQQAQQSSRQGQLSGWPSLQLQLQPRGGAGKTRALPRSSRARTGRSCGVCVCVCVCSPSLQLLLQLQGGAGRACALPRKSRVCTSLALCVCG